ncbi:HpcH/HpaI aldolase/citrate lyase family protein [Aestuariimicrobium ganziense]|uniref:HpcH/HpaI aldolase/citrate lyase family protein n=1 Tax=Aestuariimicrobium ganziense TaxID=2773677 RepID=UPI001942019A|nr:CoA ester lyase [Aestuariimicrobium ganziense]
MSSPRPRRTVLAVPGSSDRFIAKARTLAVDCLFLDLEDAVAPSAKADARDRIVTALRSDEGFAAPTVTVRVNDWGTPFTLVDLTTVIGQAGDRVDAVVLPKATRADEVTALDLVLTQLEQVAGLEVGRIGIEVQIEDALGLLHVAEIAAASPRLQSLVFGPGDYMASMGMGSLSVGGELPGYVGDHFHHALASILVAARAHDLQAIDGPYVAIRDVEGFKASARRAAALGYDGKWVLHPDQAAVGNEVFTPPAADIERASRIVEAYREAGARAGGGVGAIVVDDEMVDEAGVKLARVTLARAGQAPA